MNRTKLDRALCTMAGTALLILIGTACAKLIGLIDDGSVFKSLILSEGALSVISVIVLIIHRNREDVRGVIRRANERIDLSRQ